MEFFLFKIQFQENIVSRDGRANESFPQLKLKETDLPTS